MPKFLLASNLAHTLQGPSVVVVDRCLTAAMVHEASQPLLQQSPEGIAVCEAPWWLQQHTDTVVLITSYVCCCEYGCSLF